MKNINIFIASSSELKNDREQLILFLSRENDKLLTKDIYLKLTLWEESIDVMPNAPLQDEFNKTVKQSDIFVSLFYTKVNKFIIKEFETALGQFKKTGKPLIYTYFRDSKISKPLEQIAKEVEIFYEFQEKLLKLGHPITRYKNTEDLKLQFGNQLNMILPILIKTTKEKKEIKNPNYWLLKLNPETWNVKELNEGEETFFSPFYLGAKRPEFLLFEEVKRGDQVLGFASGEYQSIVCIMEVTSPVGPDKKWGEVFRMKVVRQIRPGIPLEKFKDHITDILSILGQDNVPPELFYRLDENNFNSIIAYAEESMEDYKNSFHPFFMTEGNHQATEDQLDFENDIDSFASVIALEKVNPPLAIGLFGNWGSGKSFFMEKLSERIQKLAELNEPEYIQNVVQVKFNSWHYSDANLWASLITQIFESLHDYATKKEYGIDAIKKIYESLNITSQQLEETQKKIEANEVEAESLNQQKENVEEIIKQKKGKLSMWLGKDLLTVVYSDPFIQSDFDNIKKQFEDENLIENINQVDQKINQIKKTRSRIFESFALLKKNQKGKWWLVWILGIIFAICAYLVLGPYKVQIRSYVNEYIVLLGLLSGWLLNTFDKISPYLKKINQLYIRLKSLKETIDKEKEKVRLTEDEEIDRLSKDINILTNDKAKLELKQSETIGRKKELDNELKEIGSGKLLKSFLADKSRDDIYLNQLGVISWIRKDFAKLNDLFRKQSAIQAKEEGLENEVKIDRIVLYIDDLDRCNEEVVVKVLEAIHLLLAFPLFVVIVGVDPRWLNNALSEKYKNLFGNRTEIIEHNKTNIAEYIFNPVYATSYDYLEKIFQIPFALKPINKTGREKLIKYLIRTEMKKDSDSSSPEPTTTLPIDITEPKQTITPEIDDENEVNKNRSVSSEKSEEKDRAKEKLVFTISELSYLQKISPLYGRTPRSINRYVNIYRIIKAHGSLKVKGDFSDNEFKPIMFMLAVIVGYSLFACEFIEKINHSDNNETFDNFLQGSGINEQLRSILQPLSEDINSFLMIEFKKNLELISRFSFRTVLE